MITSGRRNTLIPLTVVIACIAFYVLCGFYSIQPIGALPEGRTIIVWRAGGEPFFNSPDADCLKRLGYVSLMCRAMAIGNGPLDRILLRLPYMKWVYQASVPDELE